MEATIIKELISTFIAAAVVYIGFINNLRTKVTVLEGDVKELQEKCKEATEKFEEMSHKMAVQEEKLSRVESRQESHSKKYDELLELINDIKLEMVKQFGGLKSELNSFNAMVEAADKGVKINTKQRKK